jgi:hypothetical protein
VSAAARWFERGLRSLLTGRKLTPMSVSGLTASGARGMTLSGTASGLVGLTGVAGLALSASSIADFRGAENNLERADAAHGLAWAPAAG